MAPEWARSALGPTHLVKPVLGTAEIVGRGDAEHNFELGNAMTPAEALFAKKTRSRRARVAALAMLRAEAPRPGNAQLTFQGLVWCDGCGAELARQDRLARLCPAGQAPIAVQKSVRLGTTEGIAR